MTFRYRGGIQFEVQMRPILVALVVDSCPYSYPPFVLGNGLVRNIHSNLAIPSARVEDLQ